jgi:hypothetical protein
VQQPALFDRAFQRLFSREVAKATSEASVGGMSIASVGRDPAASWVLERFWQRSTGKVPLPQPPAPRTGEEASRYLTDFQVLCLAASPCTVPSKRCTVACAGGCVSESETVKLERRGCWFQELRTLGKGGYGLVVAAVNRLDGRQYAIKKIRMPSSAPAAYSRLMREVATLARLQHPNVVRYFQVSGTAAATVDRSSRCAWLPRSVSITLDCSLVPYMYRWSMKAHMASKCRLEPVLLLMCRHGARLQWVRCPMAQTQTQKRSWETGWPRHRRARRMPCSR